MQAAGLGHSGQASNTKGACRSTGVSTTPSTIVFPSRQERARQVAQEPSQQQPVGATPVEVDVKPDVKPSRRLATSYLGQPGLLRMLGVGDEDHIITKVLPVTDPLQEYDEDDPSQLMTIDYETDGSSNVDDLSVVSMTSADSISKDELQGLLTDMAAQHQKMAASMDALAARVEDMTIEQVEEAAVRLTSEIGHIHGLDKITGAFDKTEVGLILATGVRKYHEYQSLKGKREEKDIISYHQLEKKFGTNKRTLMECAQGYKYRYPKGVSTKVPFTWYYGVIKVIPIVMHKMLVILMTIPVFDKTLELNIYQVHNLPAIPPGQEVEALYQLENKYFAIGKHGLYVTLPTEQSVRTCKWR